MAILDELLPTRRQRVYDLVREAGIDVREWEASKGQSKSAASNPLYCFNYAFMGEQVVVLNLWHDHMQEQEGSVRYILHPRRSIERTTGNKQRRARYLESALRTAMETRWPIRAIVLAGQRKSAGAAKTSVTRRLLDPEVWHVETYDIANDCCTLARRKPQPTFIDQFTALQEGAPLPMRKTVTSDVATRCPRVRRQALARANGYCQYCHATGFITRDGSIFLETHHVIPLSEGGPDTLNNLVALCPNHHREAHHGAAQAFIRQQLLAYLATT